MIDFIFQHTLLAILPNSNTLFDNTALATALANVQPFMIQAFSGLGFLAPSKLLWTLIIVIIGAELALFAFHIVMVLVRLIRGAG
jgi:membrane-associated HD superfamily phosphohydrolase